MVALALLFTVVFGADTFWEPVKVFTESKKLYGVASNKDCTRIVSGRASSMANINYSVQQLFNNSTTTTLALHFSLYPCD